MATIRERKRKDGSIAYTVLWWAGGQRGSKQESEILQTRPKAELFQALVNDNGQQWPPGWVRGSGFVTRAPEFGADMPLVQWGHRSVDKLTGIDGRTRGDYHRDIDNHMALIVHTRPDGRQEPATVANVVADDITDWIRAEEDGDPDPDRPGKWRRRPAAPKSIKNRHGMIYGIFQAAVEATPPLRSDNPCAKTKLARVDDGDDEMVFLERSEYQRLRAELEAICGGDAVDLADILVSLGLRWGEATALQVRDLNLNAAEPTIRIQRAWKRQKDNSFLLGPPKTRKARRTLGLTPDQVALFRRLSIGKAHDDLLFQTAAGSRWGHSNFYYRRWQPAVRAAQAKGFPKAPRLHDLRHSYVSWLIAARIPLPKIQALLGHESITTTVDRYGHLERSLDAEVSVAIQAAMSEVTGSLRLVASA